MPFILIVGVNHHFQSVMFGGVFLQEEKVENFEWVFTEFVNMMEAKNPLAIDRPKQGYGSGNIECFARNKTSLVQMACAQKSERAPWGTICPNSQVKVDFYRIVNQMVM